MKGSDEEKLIELYRKAQGNLRRAEKHIAELERLRKADRGDIEEVHAANKRMSERIAELERKEKAVEDAMREIQRQADVQMGAEDSYTDGKVGGKIEALNVLKSHLSRLNREDSKP